VYGYYHIIAKHFRVVNCYGGQFRYKFIILLCISVLQSDFENDDLLDGYPAEDGLSQLLLNDPVKKPWALSDILQDGNELDHFKVSLSTQELRTPIVKRCMD